MLVTGPPMLSLFLIDLFVCECVFFAIFVSLSDVSVIEFQLGPILITEINGDYEMDS